jgi:aconitate hydratase
MSVAVAFKSSGKKVDPNVSMTVSPGSRQVVEMMSRSGGLADLIAAGARLLENTCGPCIGNGQSPPSDAVSLRTFNRNFIGRSGTVSAGSYLCSPEVAVAAAITGVVTDPRTLGEAPKFDLPTDYAVDDSMIIAPVDNSSSVEVLRGPNIKALPIQGELPDALAGKVLIKLGDNITTDDITPAGTWLKYRRNVPKYSESVFCAIDAEFHKKAQAAGGGFVIGGENYGQGSSREHAALCPMYLGIKAVIAKSFARIHKDNLVNFGILPLTFENPSDYDTINDGDELELAGLKDGLSGEKLKLKNVTQGTEMNLLHGYTPRQVDIIKAGGKLNYTKNSDKAAV